MKKIAWACLLLIHSASFGQDTLSTILWEVSGKNLTKPSYLFGTNHIFGPSILDSNQVVLDKLNVSELVVGETLNSTSVDSVQASQSNMGRLPKGVTIKQLLSKKDYAYLEEALKTDYQFKVEYISHFNTIQPLVLYLLLVMIDSQNKLMEGIQLADGIGVGIDGYILEYAHAHNTDVRGFESDAYQSQLVKSTIFNKSSLKRTARDLVAYLKNTDHIKEKEIKMLTDYSKHRQDYYFQKNIKREDKEMLGSRNKSWMKQLPAMMEKQSTFIAVGLGHLKYKQGLIMELRKLGYTVTPIAMD